VFRLDVISNRKVEVPGVHSTKRVFRMDAPRMPGVGQTINLPFGAFIRPNDVDPETWQGPGTFSYSAAPAPGLFAAKIPPIDWVNREVWEFMPPNVFNGPRSQDQLAPPTLPSNTKIYERVQQAIEFRPTRYPVFRNTDPHVFDPWPTLGFTTGMVIYDVIARRGPVSEGGSQIHMPPWDPAQMPELTVEVGCMRNGSFTVFDEIVIPEGEVEKRLEPHPFWPCFTPTPLAYRCDEACSVFAGVEYNLHLSGKSRAELISNGIIPPITAEHYNDLEAILALLP
jgi:hypothetical protein